MKKQCCVHIFCILCAVLLCSGCAQQFDALFGSGISRGTSFDGAVYWEYDNSKNKLQLTATGGITESRMVSQDDLPPLLGKYVTKVTFGDGITHIAPRAFSKYFKLALESIEFSASVEYVGESAFDKCRAKSDAVTILCSTDALSANWDSGLDVGSGSDDSLETYHVWYEGEFYNSSDTMVYSFTLPDNADMCTVYCDDAVGGNGTYTCIVNASIKSDGEYRSLNTSENFCSFTPSSNAYCIEVTPQSGSTGTFRIAVDCGYWSYYFDESGVEHSYYSTYPILLTVTWTSEVIGMIYYSDGSYSPEYDTLGNVRSPIGIVCAATIDGLPSKILSLDQSECSWAMSGTTEYATAFTTNLDNGIGNYANIMTESNEIANCPAFAWCVGQELDGYTWYLPAQSEMIDVYKNKDAINDGLQKVNENYLAASFPLLGTFYYWTSSQYVAVNTQVWGVDFYSGSSASFDKTEVMNVRAMANVY